MTKKFNEDDGVWRTINGRKVFIEKGQSLASAMSSMGMGRTTADRIKKQEEKMNELREKNRVLSQYRKKLSKTKTHKDIDKADKYYKRKTGKDIKEEFKRAKKNDKENVEYYHGKDKWNYVVDVMKKLAEENIDRKTISDREKRKLYDELNKKVEKLKEKTSKGKVRGMKKDISKQKLKYILDTGPYADDKDIFEMAYKRYMKEHPDSNMTLAYFRGAFKYGKK